QRETKVAEWDQVIDLGTEALRSQTKDLQIAAWLTEALARRHGFDGLRDGLRLLSGVQERFWETYHPQIDEGDLGSREGPFVFLNTTLPLLIRQVPLTAGLSEPRYSYLQWQESREVQNAGLKDQKAMQALTDAGKTTPKQWDDAVAQTPRSFYEGIFQALAESGEAFRDFEEGTDRRFGRESPSLLDVRKALEECRRLLEPILAAKRAQEPDPEPDGSRAEETPAGDAPEQSGSQDGIARPAAGQGLPIPIGAGSTLPDFGRMLIDFQRRAEELAETGKLLAENRQKHAELRAELGKLDAEYHEMSMRLSKSQEYYQLLSRLLELQNGAAARPGNGP
ncbi:MAG TPA: type VI secretion system protein TssA, partial [Thermoanaerobaculia bacterium]|nr:type VI secretion system protein TssA [Thermoanaerobaculia bacterium]